MKSSPPHTVNQAIEIIFEETGACLKHSACQSFLKKIGMKCRPCGLVPGKAMADEKQCEAITLVLDNARYQKCRSVADKSKEPGIELLYLPPVLPT